MVSLLLHCIDKAAPEGEDTDLPPFNGNIKECQRICAIIYSHQNITGLFGEPRQVSRFLTSRHNVAFTQYLASFSIYRL